MAGGHLTRGDGDRELQDLVDGVLASGRLQLVLDLAGVEYLDAAGLGMLVRCQWRAAACGGRLIVTGARTKVKELLDLSEVAEYLEQVQEIDKAVEMLSSDRPARVKSGPVRQSRVA